jgi:hypothetical protein
MLHTVLRTRPGQPQVLHPGDTALFICIPQSQGGGFQWWIDGSQVTNHDPEYVRTSIDPLLGSGALQIQNVLLVYNGSIIQCSVNGSAGMSYSNQLLLLVEGHYVAALFNVSLFPSTSQENFKQWIL